VSSPRWSYPGSPGDRCWARSPWYSLGTGSCLRSRGSAHIPSQTYLVVHFAAPLKHRQSFACTPDYKHSKKPTKTNWRTVTPPRLHPINTPVPTHTRAHTTPHNTDQPIFLTYDIIRGKKNPHTHTHTHTNTHTHTHTHTQTDTHTHTHTHQKTPHKKQKQAKKEWGGILPGIRRLEPSS
jgi:hypothetical protein